MREVLARPRDVFCDFPFFVCFKGPVLGICYNYVESGFLLDRDYLFFVFFYFLSL